MLNTFSLPDNIFIQIISKPIIIAPIKQRRATGSKLKFKVGRIKIIPPINESNAAPQRTRSMFSLKRITAKNIAKIGFRNVIAVASLIGMYKTAVNKIETPKQPKHDRRKCKRLFNDSIFGLIKQHTIVKNINEKKILHKQLE